MNESGKYLDTVLSLYRNNIDSNVD